MLRPIPYSKPFKQKLFLDTPLKTVSLSSTMSVTPLIGSPFQKQSGNFIKAAITEIKPPKQRSTTEFRTFIRSAPKKASMISEERNRYQSAIRPKTHNFKIAEKSQQSSKILDSFLKILTENKIVDEMVDEVVRMKGETFRNICAYILNCVVAKSGQQLSNLEYINKQKNIQQFIRNNKTPKLELGAQSKLKLSSGRICFTIKSQQLKDDFQSSNSQRDQLTKEVGSLLKHKAQLQDQIKVTILEIHQLKRHYSETRIKVDQLTTQYEEIEGKVQLGKDFLARIDELTTSMHEFALVTPEQIVKDSAQNYKNIQSEMFKLTQLVSHCASGKKDFQKSITLWDIEKRMESQLKMFNKFLTQNTHSTYQQKCRELKDFLAKINCQYSKIYEQLVNVIQLKTKYIKNFAEYIELWEQRYLEKSEYLGNLRTTFAEHCQKIQEMREAVAKVEQDEAKSSFYSQMMVEVQDIIHLFKIGNYFY